MLATINLIESDGNAYVMKKLFLVKTFLKFKQIVVQ